jgi:hypothetical protein
VWRHDTARRIRWSDGDGCLHLALPLPERRRLRLVGGPARRQTVTEGKSAGRTYVGGEPDGYERLVIPAERHGALNAWYRLGQPTLLGEHVGQSPLWGRIEVEPTVPRTTYLFIAVLITDAARSKVVPDVSLGRRDETLVLRLRSGGDTAVLELPPDLTAGGSIRVADRAPLTLPTSVRPDAPLPLQATSE